MNFYSGKYKSIIKQDVFDNDFIKQRDLNHCTIEIIFLEHAV